MSEEVNKEPHFTEFEHQMDPKIKALIAILLGIIGTILIGWILGGPLGPVMNLIRGTPLYHLIPFLSSVILFVILIYKAYIKKIRGLGFLGSAILFHGIAELIFFISNPAADSTIFNRGTNYLALVGDILFPLAVIMLYLHIELIDKLKPNLIHAIGIMGTALPIVFGGIAMLVLDPIDNPLFNEIVEEIRKVVLVYMGAFALIILWIALISFQVMYGTLRHADTPELALSSSLVLVGFSSILTNFLLLGVNYSSLVIDKPILFRGENFIIHNSWLVTFALLSLILAYILTPEFAYAVPFDVYQLLIINQMTGTTLYSFVNEFRQEGELTHDALKSPAIVAIQNLVQEIAHAEGHIILIGMSDRIIVMKNYKEIVSVLITEKNSYFLNRGLEDFTIAFYKEFKPHITNFTGNVDVFKPANKLIRTHLPFMRKESLLSMS